MKVELKNITPEIASTMLLNNSKNRSINDSHVSFLSNQMKKGQWVLNGQTIVIDNNGDLLDGQHRLSAIVRSGIKMDMLICTGANPDAMPTIDTGKPRKASDVLKMNGYKYSISVASTLTVLNYIDSNSFRNSRKKPTNADILNAAPQLDEIVGIEWLGRNSDKLRKTLSMPWSQVMAAIYLLANSYGKENVETFIRMVQDGGDYEGSPSHAIHTIYSKKKLSGKSTHRYFPLVLTFISFEKWIKREKIKFLRDSSVNSHLEIISKNYNSKINW